jgi:hypothetical protein
MVVISTLTNFTTIVRSSMTTRPPARRSGTICARAYRVTEFTLWTNIAGMPTKESMAAMLLIMDDLATCVNAMKAAR